MENIYKECLGDLVEALIEFYSSREVPYEIISSFENAAEILNNKKAIKLVRGWGQLPLD